MEDTTYKQVGGCTHDSCPTCNGTGIRKDGLGVCVHMVSRPCPRCTLLRLLYSHLCELKRRTSSGDETDAKAAVLKFFEIWTDVD